MHTLTKTQLDLGGLKETATWIKDDEGNHGAFFQISGVNEMTYYPFETKEDYNAALTLCIEAGHQVLSHGA
jgi:hypothetical protein